MKLVLTIAAILVLSGCGPMQALTREYYRPPTESGAASIATVTGSDDASTGVAKPTRAFVGGIDGKPVSLPKSARCSYDKRYRLAPGDHVVGISVTVGSAYTDSLVGYGELPLIADTNARYVAKAQFRPDSAATIWIEDESNGKDITARKEITLKDSPQKGIPVGFAAIANSCSLP